MERLPSWAPGEEEANMWTHAIGTPISVFAILAFLIQGRRSNDYRKLVTNVIFGVSMLIVYTVSTLYHGVTDPEFKKVLRYCDHICIYLHIAGGYTPFLANLLRGKISKVILTFIWIIAVVGSVMKIVAFDKLSRVSLYLYVAMGWTIVFAMRNLVKVMERPGLYLLILGGLLQTAGTFFFAKGDEIVFSHAIWHIFVLFGSICQIICVYYYC